MMKTELRPGTRIQLVRMEDPYPLPPGSTGTILSRDCNGDYEVRWDCGSALKLIPSIDQWKVIDSE